MTLFIRERVFEETKNAKFTSLFCQKFYVYKILGIARGQNPLAYENFVFGELNMHNFRPLSSLNLQRYRTFGWTHTQVQKTWGGTFNIVSPTLQNVGGNVSPCLPPNDAHDCDVNLSVLFGMGMSQRIHF